MIIENKEENMENGKYGWFFMNKKVAEKVHLEWSSMIWFVLITLECSHNKCFTAEYLKIISIFK